MAAERSLTVHAAASPHTYHAAHAIQGAVLVIFWSHAHAIPKYLICMVFSENKTFGV